MATSFKHIIAVVCIALVTAPASVSAQITVDRAVVVFQADQKPISNVTVRNTGEGAMYVQVVAEAMQRPGFSDEARQETSELIASPKRFSIPPQGQRTIRLVLKKPGGSAEQVFRVKFLPVAESFDDVPQSKTEQKTVLKVLYSVGILILAEPSKVEEKLVWAREGDSIKFVNEGNVNVLLDEGKSCVKGSDSDCTELQSTRLYPGNSWSVTVPEGRTAVFRKRVNELVNTIAVDG